MENVQIDINEILTLYKENTAELINDKLILQAQVKNLQKQLQEKE